MGLIEPKTFDQIGVHCCIMYMMMPNCGLGSPRN